MSRTALALALTSLAGLLIASVGIALASSPEGGIISAGLFLTGWAAIVAIARYAP